MSENPIGYIWDKDSSGKEKDVSPIANVEQGFRDLIKELEIDEEMARKHAEMDERVRRELLIIYNRLKDLEKKVQSRHNLANQCQAYQQNNPQKSLELLDRIDRLDQEILPEAQKLAQEIGKHALPDVAQVYKEVELTQQHTMNIRSLANVLSARLNGVVGGIQSAVAGQYTNQVRHTILTTNPELGK